MVKMSQGKFDNFKAITRKTMVLGVPIVPVIDIHNFTKLQLSLIHKVQFPLFCKIEFSRG